MRQRFFAFAPAAESQGDLPLCCTICYSDGECNCIVGDAILHNGLCSPALNEGSYESAELCLGAETQCVPFDCLTGNIACEKCQPSEPGLCVPLP